MRLGRNRNVVINQQFQIMRNIDRRFCAIYYGPEDKPLLCLPNEGYFATDAFCAGKVYGTVSGRSFGIIAGDDNLIYVEDKSNISEVCDEAILKLLEDPRLNSEFIEKCLKILHNGEPVRAEGPWFTSVSPKFIKYTEPSKDEV